MELNNIIPYSPQTIGSLRFNIPLYQRLFEWTDLQLNGLLNDLAVHIKRGKSKTYYLGMMTGNQSSPIDLIDGQQRFTTIMLIGIVLREFYPEWNKFVVTDRLSFSARPNDKAYLDYLITKKYGNKVEENEYMEKGIILIRDFVDKDLGEYAIPKVEFAQKVYEQLTFFVSILPQNYKENPRKLNQYFEAMNSSGRSLEQHEKLKVDLLTRIADSKEKSILNSIWNISEKFNKPVFFSNEEDIPLDIVDEWIVNLVKSRKTLKDISEKKSSDEDSMNLLTIEQISPSSEPYIIKENISRSSSVLNFAELLLLALDITLNQQKPYNKSKLEERFTELPNEKIHDFYLNLIICRLILDRFVIRIYKDGQYNRYVLKLTEDSVIPNIVKQNKQYQSMLYAAGSSEVHHLWLTPFVEWIISYVRDKGGIPNPEQLYIQLRKIDESIPSHRLPEVNVLRYRQSASIYLFQRLDYILWEKIVISQDYSISTNYKDLVSGFIPGTNRSIEHFHPQNESHNIKWPEKYDEVNDPLNSLGNLALISSDFNSQQSNDNENLKLARIKEHIDGRRLQSLKLLLMYEIAVKNDGHWTVDLAVQHGYQMMQLLKESYTHKTE